MVHRTFSSWCCRACCQPRRLRLKLPFEESSDNSEGPPDDEEIAFPLVVEPTQDPSLQLWQNMDVKPVLRTARSCVMGVCRLIVMILVFFVACFTGTTHIYYPILLPMEAVVWVVTNMTEPVVNLLVGAFASWSFFLIRSVRIGWILTCGLRLDVSLSNERSPQLVCLQQLRSSTSSCAMVPMLLVMLLPFVAFSVQRQARGRLEIRQVREGGGLDHSPETFAEYELQGAPGVPQGVQVLADQHPALNSWFGASSFGILMAEWCAIVEDPMVFNFDVYLPSGKHVHVVVQGSNVEDLIAAVERSFGGVSIRLVTLQGELLVPTQSIREAGLSDGDSLMAVVSPQPQQLCWHFQRGTCTRGPVE
eukprot:symbB.v1.2.014633.t1/scaffold1040.1/size142515/9